MSNIETLTQRPFEGIDAKTRKEREFKTLAPVFLKKLTEKFTREEVGDLVGVSVGAVANYIKNNTTSQAVEMAARFVYEEKFPAVTRNKTKQTVAIIRGELAHIKTIEDMVRNLGGDFQHIGEF